MNKVLKEDLEAIIGENIPWEKLKGRTVLITGASGMIGIYMLQVLTLLNERYDYNIRVIAMLRNAKKLPKEVREREDVEIIVHDSPPHIYSLINVNTKSTISFVACPTGFTYLSANLFSASISYSFVSIAAIISFASSETGPGTSCS